MAQFDVIVVGLGAMGAAALDALARRGARVLGLEQFELGHDRGSSHGETRIIRRSYFEHPDYVPLVNRSYVEWHQLERDSGCELLRTTGLLISGPPDSTVVRGVQTAAAIHKFDLEQLLPEEARSRFPGLAPSDGHTVLFEKGAGFLRTEACVQALASRAKKCGGQIQTECEVKNWTADDAGARVVTAEGEFRAGRLVLCAGPWMGRLLGEWRLPLVVRRKPVFWFEAPDSRFKLDEGFPIFGFDVDDGFFYGFPELGRNGSVDSPGVKVADHSGGDEVSDPSNVDRSARNVDLTRVEGFVRTYLPGLSSRVLRHRVCMYTMSPDEHFIVGPHARHSRVLIAAGFSGHGFKFAPLIGSVLADLALAGKTKEPVGFLGPVRFGAV